MHVSHRSLPVTVGGRIKTAAWYAIGKLLSLFRTHDAGNDFLPAIDVRGGQKHGVRKARFKSLSAAISILSHQLASSRNADATV